MIGRGTKLKVLVFVVVSLLGVTYVGVRYVGLGDRLLGGGYVVHLDLARAGGIFPHAPVTYRGVPVGRVTAVTLRGEGVRADLRIQRGVRVPAELRAVVAQRSAVGEQYVDLRPERDAGPYLRDGAVIPADRTGVPLAPEVLLSNLDALVRSVGPDDLAVLVTELGTAFAGNEQALARILDAGDALLADATEALPETLTLIEDARTVLATQAESAEALRRWAAGLAQLAAAVRAADPDLRRLLAAGPPAGDELVALLRGLEPTVGTLLGNLVTVNGIAARRLPGIEQLLVVYPITVAGGFTVTPGDGTAHLGLVLNANDPPSCVYQGGGRQCSAGDRAAGAGVRGAGNAPRSSGAGPAPAGGAARPGAGPAGYDPATGLVLGGDGRPLQFGGTGGQYRTAGDQSWKQLLLAGVTP
ncbi:MCE family protein [Micromonospora deserti]|uniref:ABC transporter substrate-binding protein n=1 Tax=Micromonospora deserti TaxID=2070366 RepID=A0A2W2CTD7_9ACTN|nr:MlaD family protein [Micromonospora deserti]PZG01111.1 ABC transporter substrate-binding protein [Micromonospora deserti]